MEKTKYDFDHFIPPDQIDLMTDKEYYDYLRYNLKKSEEDLRNGRYISLEEFQKEMNKELEEYERLENENKNAR